MEELTLEELIKYTVRIQQDSFLFYRKAAKILEGNELKPLTDELADFKASHLKRLKELLGEYALETQGSDYMVDVDTTLVDEILDSGEIPAQATPRDVLLLSLSREDKTRRIFEMVLSLSSLDDKAQRTFGTLRQEEEAQVVALRERITHVRQR